MDDKTFYERFQQELFNIAENEGFDNIHKAFIFWVGKNYLFLEDDEDIKSRISDGSSDEGIDAIFIDETNHIIYLINATTVENFENTTKNLPENDLKIMFQGFRFITKGDYRGKVNPKLEDLTKEYHQLLNTGEYKVKIMFFHFNKIPSDLKYLEEFKKDFNQVDVEFFDFGKIRNFYDRYLVYREPAPTKVSLEVKGNILKNDEVKKTLIFSISGKQLANIFLTYGTSIFQRNVRYFLANRNKSINFQMEQTASDDTKSKLFWYFNNGITIVCSKITEAPNGQVVILDKMQIINGAQTTFSLFEAFNKNKLKEDVRVLVKAIEADETEFIDDLTLYTNSQNPVNLRDLCSKDDIQTKIQTVLKIYRYFYERKRGEFQALYPTDEIKEKEFGKNWKDCIIKNEKAAQAYLAMFLDKPSQAKSSKKRIFLKDSSGFYSTIFHPALIEEKMLMTYKLLLYIEDRKNKYIDIYDNAEELPEKEKNEIYKLDFLLHSDFFILNLFKDFLKEKGFDFDKNGSLKIKKLIESDDEIINSIYNHIISLIQEYISKIKGEDETYYHNKFFKNDSSIGLMRNYIHTEKGLEFVQII